MTPSSDWRWEICTRVYYPTYLAEWVASRPKATFYDLWDETINPEWLPYLAQVGGATKEQLILAACAVVRLCFQLLPDDSLVKIAIETAEAWCRNEATLEQVEEAKSNIRAHSFATPAYFTLSAASSSAIYAAHAAISTANAVYWTLLTGVENQLVCATIRKHLPFERPPKLKGLTVWQRLAMEDQ